MLPDLSMPEKEQESADPLDADNKYQSATNFLRKYTRDRTEYPIVYRDNVAYGFARNLYSIRCLGIFVSALCIIMNIGLLIHYNSAVPSSVDTATLVFGGSALLISTAVCAGLVCFVTADFVKKRGMDYARSLFSTCEELADKNPTR